MTTKNFQNWAHSSRSEIRSATAQMPMRRRNYVKRTALIAICFIAFFVVWYVVYFRAVAIDGDASFIYEIHDRFYIWFRGNFWVSYFPYSLIWASPIAFALAIFVLEYLSPIKPSKSIQRFVTIRMLKNGIGRRILKIGSRSMSKLSASNWETELQTGTETIRKGFGFTKRVLIELLMVNRIKLIDAFEAGDSRKIKKILRILIELSEFRVVLGAYGPVFLFGLLECLAIYQIGKDENRRLYSLLRDIESAFKRGVKSESGKADSAEIIKCLMDLMENSKIESGEASQIVVETCKWIVHSEYCTTCELATRFIRATTLILSHKLPEGRDLLESWTLRRYGLNCSEVLQAEQLVHFAFWCQQIDEVAARYQMSGVVANLWPERNRLADTGEDFARSGRLKHG